MLDAEHRCSHCSWNSHSAHRRTSPPMESGWRSAQKCTEAPVSIFSTAEIVEKLFDRWSQPSCILMYFKVFSQTFPLPRTGEVDTLQRCRLRNGDILRGPTLALTGSWSHTWCAGDGWWQQVGCPAACRGLMSTCVFIRAQKGTLP